MERDNIGISDVMASVAKKPEKYARFLLAPMVVKLLAQSIRQNGKWKPLSIKDTLLTAGQHPTEAQIQKITTIVTQILQLQTEWKKLSEFADPESLSLVGTACMHVLWDWLHARWQIELAHYIHNTTHISPQPTRLDLLDRGIIPANRIFHDIGNENTQLWSGRETKRKYTWLRWINDDNIIALLQKNSGESHFQIKPILRGQKIKILEDQVLVFQDGNIYVYHKPDKNNPSEFPSLWEFPCDINVVQNVTSSKKKTWWSLYQITGTQKNEVTTRKKNNMTLCINEQYPSLSYTTDSEGYDINGNTFTVDNTRKQFIILAQWKIQRIAFREIVGIVKLPNGEQHVDFIQRWLHMRLSFSGSTPVVSIETESGWRVYENAITETSPEEDPASTFSIDEWARELVIDTWWKIKRIPLDEILEAFRPQQ